MFVNNKGIGDYNDSSVKSVYMKGIFLKKIGQGIDDGGESPNIKA